MKSILASYILVEVFYSTQCLRHGGVKIISNAKVFIWPKNLNLTVDFTDYNIENALKGTRRLDNDDDFGTFHESDDEEADDDDSEDGWNVGGGNRIVGGNTVDINLYPYHVGYGSNCAGAIIHKLWVITTAHCGHNKEVRVGTKYIDGGYLVKVAKHYLHPKWTARNKQHPFDWDFQLLKLSKAIKFDSDCKKIKIAEFEHMVVGRYVTVTGWGATTNDGEQSDVLRAVRVPIILKSRCQQVDRPYFQGNLTKRMFCAGPDDGTKDACQGDSGGPAAAHDRLLGLVSFGYLCATPGSYGVYAKVASARPWIKATTGLKLD